MLASYSPSLVGSPLPASPSPTLPRPARIPNSPGAGILSTFFDPLLRSSVALDSGAQPWQGEPRDGSFKPLRTVCQRGGLQRMWAGLGKAAREATEPQGWHHWGAASSPRPRGGWAERDHGELETKLCCGRGAWRKQPPSPQTPASTSLPFLLHLLLRPPIGQHQPGEQGSWSPGEAIHREQPPGPRCGEEEGREWVWRNRQKIPSTLPYGKH